MLMNSTRQHPLLTPFEEDPAADIQRKPLPRIVLPTRWIVFFLVGFYVCVAGGLALLAVSASQPGSVCFWVLGLPLAIVAIQAMLIFSTGTRDFLAPVRPARRFVSFAIFAVMALGILIGVLLVLHDWLLLFCMSNWVLFPDEHQVRQWNLEWAIIRSIELPVVITLGLVWLFWIVVVARVSWRTNRFDFVARLWQNLFVGSLLELLIAVPSIFVLKSTGYCLAGLASFIAACGGVLVILVTMGPAAIWLMFLYARRLQRREDRFRASAVLDDKSAVGS